MPNKNYVKGRRKEYKLAKEELEAGADIVQRTAGSHSPIDIISINKTKKLIRFIQSKPDSMSEKEKKRIEEKNKDLNDWFYCEFIVK